MSQPQRKSYSQTVFFVEGFQAAVIVTAIGDRLSERRRRFISPEAALAWCRANRAGLVYTPAATSQN